LALSCAALIDRESNQAETSSQNAPISLDAQRRQQQRPVGPL